MWSKIPSSTVENGGGISRIIIHQKMKPAFRENGKKKRQVKRGNPNVLAQSSFIRAFKSISTRVG